MGPSVRVHKEHHIDHGDLIRDAIIGFSDGLTVPFALCAGLSSLGEQRLVVIGGLAELFAGAISMGAGALLAAFSERKHYAAEEARERREVQDAPEEEEQECVEILQRYGVPHQSCQAVVDALKANEDMWVQFMMDFELRLKKPDTKLIWLEGLVMGVAYFLGGLLPMVPYFILPVVNDALFVSIGITVVILIIFGWTKARIMGVPHAWLSALQTLVIGIIAAGSAYAIVRAVNSADAV